jgi:hypothetical protein
MRAPLFGVACALTLASIPLPALAQHARGTDIVIETPGERTTNNKLVLGGIAGAGVIAGALGLYFHLDSRSASNDVSADAKTGRAWTQEDVDLADRASSSRTRAAVGYSIGGALLIGAAIALIVTEPKSETTVIRARSTQPTISPTPGGAVVGGMWSF